MKNTDTTFEQWLKNLPYQNLSNRAMRPQGFVQESALGTFSQLQLVTSWLVGLHADTKPFLLHLLASSASACADESRLLNERGYVPLYSRFIRQHFRNADIKELKRRTVIEALPHSRTRGRSREYRVVPERWIEFLKAGLRQHRNSNKYRVDLLTEKQTTRRVKTKHVTPSGGRLPVLVRDSINSVGPARFNCKAIEKHLRKLEKRYRRQTQGTPEWQKAYLRYANDLRCYNALFDQGARHVEDDIWQYQPAYRVQKSGRIGQIGGGLQNCSRRMKQAAYRGIAGLHNYDLRASQARILLADMQQRKISCKWLENYANNSKEKQVAAKFVGISVEAWKRCFYAILMGARLPPPTRILQSRGTLSVAIVENVGQVDAEATYRKLLKLIEPFRRELQIWRNQVVQEALQAVTTKTANAREKKFSNAAGMRVTLPDLDPKVRQWKINGAISAFVLQGREAVFIHALSESAKSFGFSIFSNEYDGLVVCGKIPQPAIDAAAKRAQLPIRLVRFEEKRFV